jgi:hypothetical protein
MRSPSIDLKSLTMAMPRPMRKNKGKKKIKILVNHNFEIQHLLWSSQGYIWVFSKMQQNKYDFHLPVVRSNIAMSDWNGGPKIARKIAGILLSFSTKD